MSNERCRYIWMYDFFQLKRLLVGILFHNLRHPYIPLHFEEKIFPLVTICSCYDAIAIAPMIQVKCVLIVSSHLVQLV